MGLPKENIQLLIELGFTKNQASLYLALLTYGKSDARTLSLVTNVPRTEIYRNLSGLAEKGLVDKGIGLPSNFSAVSPSLGLQNALEKKIKEVKRTEAKTIEFIKSYSYKEDYQDNSQYTIKILNGRKRIIQKIKEQHDSAKSAIDVISILPRWLQIIDECIDNYINALKRGVKYRIMIGVPDCGSSLPKKISCLLNEPNFKLKTIGMPQSINSAVFDFKEVTFNYYPSKSLGDSPLILTNHPSFLDLSKGYFENLWTSPSNSDLRSCQS